MSRKLLCHAHKHVHSSEPVRLVATGYENSHSYHDNTIHTHFHIFGCPILIVFFHTHAGQTLLHCLLFSFHQKQSLSSSHFLFRLIENEKQNWPCTNIVLKK